MCADAQEADGQAEIPAQEVSLSRAAVPTPSAATQEPPAKRQRSLHSHITVMPRKVWMGSLNLGSASHRETAIRSPVPAHPFRPLCNGYHGMHARAHAKYEINL